MTKDPLVQLIEQLVLNEQMGNKVDAVIKRLDGIDSLEEVRSEVGKMTLDGLLERIGSGWSRNVYEIDDDHVLKVMITLKRAINNQNEAEASPELREILRDYMPRIYQRHPDNLWLVAERVDPLNYAQEQDWLDAVGLPFMEQPEYLGGFLDAMYEYEYGDKLAYDEAALYVPQGYDRDEIKQALFGNELVSRLLELRINHGISLTDLKLRNLGFGADGRPVILDIGLEKDSS